MEGGAAATIDTVVTSITAMAQTVSDNVLSMLGAIIPVAATAVAAVVVAKRGKGLVKSMTK